MNERENTLPEKILLINQVDKILLISGDMCKSRKNG